MDESMKQVKSPESSQYHHFIPRLILRNFAVFKNPGRIVPKSSAKSKTRPPKPQKLTILDLPSRDFKQGDVGETFGIVDMYRDFKSAGRDQQKLERELSVLESAAGEILSRIKKTHEAGKKEVQLIRKDKDTLRRFLFIMMYRNSGFAHRFEKSREDYDSDDRADMLAYMDDKGFKTPRDVWFANIRAFLEVKLDDEHWPSVLAELQNRAYPMDARWFFAHVQAFYIAFCTPKTAGDEFLLTQNAYGIYEGPTSAGLWTDYHRFAPVSPKIMIVLRSLMLPCAGLPEDMDTQKMMFEMTKLMHLDPDRAGSWLEDMPISRAGNNYSRVVNGRVEPLPTKISRDKHVFYFPFFPLDHEHVQKINMICLENAYDTLAIVYKSPESLRTALEFYLTVKAPGFKMVCSTQPYDLAMYVPDMLQEALKLPHVRREDKLLPYLQLLLEFAKRLGSTVKLEYSPVDGPEMPPVPSMEIEPEPRYAKLGGTSASLFLDMEQSRRIVNLIVKVDTAIRGCNDKIKHVVRRNREDLIASLPARRVWLSVKQLRLLEQIHTGKSMSLDSSENKEDAIVNGKPASHIFESDSLARIIYMVFSIDHFLSKQPHYGLTDAFTLDAKGAKAMRQELALVFNTPGSIRHCGIAAVEEIAQWLSTQPRPARDLSGRNFLDRVVSDEQAEELFLRRGIEMGFDGMLEGQLGGAEIRALRDVFFKHLYRSEIGDRMRR